MARHYTELSSDYYNYLVVDEAHHAVAPILKRVIQYYNTDFTIGLTATDQRPDKKKLETVFGTYSTSLSLKEAMEKGIVAKANVYRIETNIDLSKVRFNGKDYVNADLEKTWTDCCVLCVVCGDDSECRFYGEQRSLRRAVYGRRRASGGIHGSGSVP